MAAKNESKRAQPAYNLVEARVRVTKETHSKVLAVGKANGCTDASEAYRAVIAAGLKAMGMGTIPVVAK